MKNIICLIFVFTLCQCASLEKSIGLGAAIGTGAGITASQLSHYNTKGHIVLGLSGALIGGVVAALLHKEPLEEQKIEVPPASFMSTSPPPLNSAEKDVLWIPDKIEGDKFVEKHRVWTIKKPAHWKLRDSEEDVEELSEGVETNE